MQFYCVALILWSEMDFFFYCIHWFDDSTTLTIQCKHVLATHLAVKLSRCIERYVTADSLIELFNKQLSTGG